MDHLPKHIQTETGGLSKFYSLFDSRLSAHLLGACHLAICAGDTDLRYLLIEEDDKEVLAVGHLLRPKGWDELPDLFQIPALSAAFEKLKGLSFSNLGAPAVLMPAQLCSAEDASTQLRLNYGSIEGEVYTFRPYDSDIWVGSAIDAQEKEAVLGLFPRAKFVPVQGAMIASLDKRHQFVSVARLYINYQDGGCFIYMYANNRLVFYNQFQIKEVSDAVYYVLGVIQESGLEAKDVDCVLSGTLYSGHPFYELLQSYVKNLSWHPESPVVAFSSQLKDMPKTEYVDLINQYLCV